MGIEDIAELWCKRVTQEVKDKYPEIDQLLTTVNTTLNTIRTIRGAYVIALQVYKAIQLAVEASAAVTAQQGSTYAAGLLGVNTQTLLFGLIQDALTGLGAQVSAKLVCEPETETEKPESQQSPLDKEFKKAQDLLGINLCSSGLFS